MILFEKSIGPTCVTNLFLFAVFQTEGQQLDMSQSDILSQCH